MRLLRETIFKVSHIWTHDWTEAFSVFSLTQTTRHLMAFLKCEEALKYFAECINFQTNLPCCIHFQSKWNARQCHACSRTWQWKLQVLVTVKSPSSIFWLWRCNHHGAVTTMPLKHRPPRLLMHPLTSWVEHARNQWMELSELLCYPASAFFCIHPFCLQYHSSSL